MFSKKLKNMKTLNYPAQINDWKLTEWYGNPSLNLIAYLKVIRRVKIWVWIPETGGFNFTVNAGPNSDRSYTGGFYGDTSITTIEQAIEAVEQKEKQGKLF